MCSGPKGASAARLRARAQEHHRHVAVVLVGGPVAGAAGVGLEVDVLLQQRHDVRAPRLEERVAEQLHERLLVGGGRRAGPPACTPPSPRPWPWGPSRPPTPRRRAQAAPADARRGRGRRWACRTGDEPPRPGSAGERLVHGVVQELRREAARGDPARLRPSTSGIEPWSALSTRSAAGAHPALGFPGAAPARSRRRIWSIASWLPDRRCGRCCRWRRSPRPGGR